MSYTIQRSTVALAGPAACGSAVHNVVRCELTSRPFAWTTSHRTVGRMTAFIGFGA